MQITRVICPANKVAIKCPYDMTPTRIVVHNTANDASAMSEISYMLGNDNYTSFHYAVDDYRAVQGIEEYLNSWNAGDGSGIGNMQGISIEICYSKSGGDLFIQAEKNAVTLIVDILKRYGWGIEQVTKHQDYSGKYCPHRTLDMGWQRFLDMVNDELNKEDDVKITREEFKWAIAMIYGYIPSDAELDKATEIGQDYHTIIQAMINYAGNKGIGYVTFMNNATVYTQKQKATILSMTDQLKVANDTIAKLQAEIDAKPVDTPPVTPVDDTTPTDTSENNAFTTWLKNQFTALSDWLKSWKK